MNVLNDVDDDNSEGFLTSIGNLGDAMPACPWLSFTKG